MDILKIGRSTFYKLLQSGELKGFKEGNRYKVPIESIEEYVNKRMRFWIYKNTESSVMSFRIFWLSLFMLLLQNVSE